MTNIVITDAIRAKYPTINIVFTNNKLEQYHPALKEYFEKVMPEISKIVQDQAIIQTEQVCEPMQGFLSFDPEAMSYFRNQAFRTAVDVCYERAIKVFSEQWEANFNKAADAPSP